MVKVFASLYPLNFYMDLVDTLPVVRHWSEVLCFTIMTYLCNLQVEDHFKCLWLDFLEVVYLLNIFMHTVHTLPAVRYCVVPSWSVIKVIVFEI